MKDYKDAEVRYETFEDDGINYVAHSIIICGKEIDLDSGDVRFQVEEAIREAENNE